MNESEAAALTNHAFLASTLLGIYCAYPQLWRHATITRVGFNAPDVVYLALDDGNGVEVRASWLAGQFASYEALVGMRASYCLRWTPAPHLTGIINQQDWICYDKLIIGEKPVYGAHSA